MALVGAGNNDELFGEEDEPEGKETEKTNRQRARDRIDFLFKTFVKIHKLPVIVVPQFFDFMTDGEPLDKDVLKAAHVSCKAKVQMNTVSPAYTLLQKICRHSGA